MFLSTQALVRISLKQVVPIIQILRIAVSERSTAGSRVPWDPNPVIGADRFEEILNIRCV
jgi:hypothetical protein